MSCVTCCCFRFVVLYGFVVYGCLVLLLMVGLVCVCVFVLHVCVVVVLCVVLCWCCLCVLFRCVDLAC